MKNIDRFFAMCLLSAVTGKTEKQILEEVRQESGDWPMGVPELENALIENQKFAKATLKHFAFRRPVSVLKEDIQVIDLHVKGPRSAVREFELDGFRNKIKAVFDLYEEKK